MKMLYTILMSVILSAVPSSYNVTGIWRVDWNTTVSLMSQTDRAVYDQLPQTQRDLLTESFADREFTFEQNGQLSIRFTLNGTNQSFNGTWVAVGADSLQMRVQDRVSTYRMELQSESKLKLIYLNASQRYLPKTIALTKL